MLFPHPWVVSSHICCDLYFAEYLQVAFTDLQDSVCSFLLSSTLVSNSCLGLPSLSASSPQLRKFPELSLDSPSLSHDWKLPQGSKLGNRAAMGLILLVFYLRGITDFCYLMSSVFKIIVLYILFKYFGGANGGIVSRKRVHWFLFFHLD